MSNDMPGDVDRQYASPDPLLVRMQTHQRYGERTIDLDEVCFQSLAISGDEMILDAGCGPGRFLDYIREREPGTALTGLDQSEAMVSAVNNLGIDAVRADIQAIPFDSASFDCVIARHMLYLVPDIPLALSEIRRVLKSDGSLLVTTNSNGSMPRILELLQDLLGAFDLPEWERPDARFCIENANGFLEDAGFAVRERIIDNALVFHDPDPVIAYCISTLPSLDVPQEPALFAEMERWLAGEASQRLDRLGGEWRDPTWAGIYVGSNPDIG